MCWVWDGYLSCLIYFEKRAHGVMIVDYGKFILKKCGAMVTKREKYSDPHPPPPPPKTNVEDLLGLLHLQHSDLLTAQSTIQIMTGGGGGYVGTI